VRERSLWHWPPGHMSRRKSLSLQKVETLRGVYP